MIPLILLNVLSFSYCFIVNDIDLINKIKKDYNPHDNFIFYTINSTIKKHNDTLVIKDFLLMMTLLKNDYSYIYYYYFLLLPLFFLGFIITFVYFYRMFKNTLLN